MSAQTQTPLADPITTEVVRNFMSACAEDMNATLFRSAYTPIIYEGRDCAVALLDRQARPLGQSTGVPLFLCNLEVCVQHTLDLYGEDWFQPGDIIAMNDSYVQGSHLHDVTVFGPIFAGDELVGFAATRAHWQDVGGKDPGTSMQTFDVYQEGFRLAPTKVIRGYEPVPEWMDFMRRNSRLGYELIGDFFAQVAACRTGEERVRSMVERVGPDVFASAIDNIFEQAEEIHREAVRELADGVYTASGCLDSDGVGDDPVPVQVKVTIDGERMEVDLTGTAGPQRGPVNCGRAQTLSAIQLAYKSLIKPNLPITGGAFAPLEVVIPEECFLNAREPMPCEWYFTSLGLVASLIISALAPALGDDAVAPDFGDSMVIALTGEKPGGRVWVSSEPTAGGWGGGPRGDGESGLISLNNGSFKNVPVEVFETKFPIRIERFALRPDTGGAGLHRGGCGVQRSYRLKDDMNVSLWFERSRTPAWGLEGGHDGAGPDCDAVAPDGSVWRGLKVNQMALSTGTLVTIRTGGGGGYGPPLQRPVEAVVDDVRLGLVSAAGAARDYGVVLDPETLAVDEAATAARRRGDATA